MDEREVLARQFEENRAHLRSVAYRMLGSANEADDAVQEAWLRLSRVDAGQIENFRGWLTTVVARVSLDMLRSRKARREPAEDHSALVLGAERGGDPEHEAQLADAVGGAMLVVLDRLTPAERVALVLHDMFEIPFDEIAAIIGRSPAAVRQLASRARRRVQGATADGSDLSRRRQVVDAFLAASRGGDFAALLAVLDPDVVLRADPAAVRAGAEREVRGAAAVAGTFKGRARAARPALVNGAPGAAWVAGGQLRIVFAFRVRRGRIVQIDIIADSERIRRLDVAVLAG